MTKYRFTSAALSELAEATLHYEQEESGLGTIFLGEISAAVERILRFPHAWHHCTHEQGVAELIVFHSACFIRFANHNLTSPCTSLIIILLTIGGDRLRQGP